eukprot:scaffold2.g7370.t1
MGLCLRALTDLVSQSRHFVGRGMDVMVGLSASQARAAFAPARALRTQSRSRIAGAQPLPVGAASAGLPGQARRAAAAAGAAAAAAEPQAPSGNGAAQPGAAQRSELPKNFDPADSEERLYQWWESAGYFAPDPDAAGEPFVMSMPPPNVTGKLHMGHAMFATLQDIMARYQRMRGRPTLWLPGTDHAGIATQMVVEKQLAAEGKDRRSLGREAFEAQVWAWKAQYGGFITQQLRRLGASCDWGRERFTLDAGLSEAVAEAFVRLHDRGLIYRGAYLVNWSPGLQTAVSDLEVEYSEEPGTMYYFKYPVTDSEEYLPVATTRPETILGDTAVAVHPEDPRYAHLVGREVVVPQSGGRRIPVLADAYVDREFGTGALKITPGHDPNDYELGRRFSLPTINIMADDGTLNAAAGPYAGLDRFAARKALWADMKAAGLVLKEEPHTLRVPRSQRGGEVVEPLVREQWFVRMDALAKPALEAVANGDIRIVPERFEKVYNHWLENIKDWCISRQLWWGHRIPVWYVVAAPNAPPAAAAAGEDSASASASGAALPHGQRYVVARSEAEAYAKARAAYGEGVVLEQESDVLDTWFSSGLWPFSTLGWPQQTADLERFYPTAVMETGHDILFFWVARMAMMGLEFTGKPPFHTVYLHGLVRDDKGRKMSKSLGNVVDPVEVIAQYGADALRWTLATGTAPGQDLNLSLDRLTSARNFTNKLWQAGKFLLFNLAQADGAEWARLAAADFSVPAAFDGLPLAERWVLSELHATAAAITAAQERYDFGEAGRLLYDFVWSGFADWYIEAAKARLYGEDAAAAAQTRAVLAYAYETILRLAHPFMPFITEELWQAVPHGGPALIAAPWPGGLAPAAGGGAAAAQQQQRRPEQREGQQQREQLEEQRRHVDVQAVEQFEVLQAAVRAVRNARAEYGVEPGRRVAATLRVASPELRAALQGEAAALALLAKLDPETLQLLSPEEAAHLSGAKGQIELVVCQGVEALLPLAGLFDAAKETERLAKQASAGLQQRSLGRARATARSLRHACRAKVEKELAALDGRLGNASFVDRAPQKVVDEVRAQAEEMRQQLAMIDDKLAKFAALA